LGARGYRRCTSSKRRPCAPRGGTPGVPPSARRTGGSPRAPSWRSARARKVDAVERPRARVGVRDDAKNRAGVAVADDVGDLGRGQVAVQRRDVEPRLRRREIRARASRVSLVSIAANVSPRLSRGPGARAPPGWPRRGAGRRDALPLGRDHRHVIGIVRRHLPETVRRHRHPLRKRAKTNLRDSRTCFNRRTGTERAAAPAPAATNETCFTLRDGTLRWSLGLRLRGGVRIGRATAERFGREGGRVACADVNATGAEETAATIRAAGGDAFAVPCDVTSPGAVVRSHRRDGCGVTEGCTWLANVAGIGFFRRTTETTLEEWSRMIAVNLTGSS